MPGHKFDPDKAYVLDNPIRKLILSPEKVLKSIKPLSEDTWADIGCGNGYFTIPFAKLVRKIYALDISPKMIDKLTQKMRNPKIQNIEAVKSGENSIPLRSESIDGVFMAFVAHELNEPSRYVLEVAKILKPGGRLVIVEYAKVPSWGPPLNHRLAPEDMERWAKNVGLNKSNAWQWSRSIIGWEYTKSTGRS